MSMDQPRAGFDLLMPDDPVAAIVLVLAGGKPESRARSRPWQLSNLRMRPFTRRLAKQGRSRGIAVAQLRYRMRGWNGVEQSPVADGVWALQQLREHFGSAPVVVLGHSMGGRTAAHLAARPEVLGVVALAPWWPEQEGRAFRTGQQLLVLHGAADRWTDPEESARQVRLAAEHGVAARWRAMPGGHFMLRSPRLWQREAVRTAISWADPSQRRTAPNAGQES